MFGNKEITSRLDRIAADESEQTALVSWLAREFAPFLLWKINQQEKTMSAFTEQWNAEMAPVLASVKALLAEGLNADAIRKERDEAVARATDAEAALVNVKAELAAATTPPAPAA